MYIKYLTYINFPNKNVFINILYLYNILINENLHINIVHGSYRSKKYFRN